MAGPLVFWPNRKSGLGLRVLSRVPRSLRHRFFTTPPIAKDDDMSALIDDRDSRAFLVKQIEELTDERARLIDAATRAREQLRAVGAEASQTQNELARMRAEIETFAIQVRTVADENDRLRADNAAKTADLRRLHKEFDPDEIKLRIMYAVDEALEKANGEKADLRRDLTEAESEIAELKRSKKRLREALDRLAKQT